MDLRFSGADSNSGRILVPATATAVALLVVLFLWRDFGITWDETVHVHFGEAVRKYFAGGFDYRMVADFPVANMRHYGTLVDVTNAVLARLTGSDLYHWRHLLNGLCWAACFWPVCAVAGRMGGRRAAVLAGLALLTQPVFFGHGFSNPKDTPLACAVAWVVFAVVRATETPTLHWNRALAVGAAMGLALATRPGALFLIPVVASPFVFQLPTAWKGTSRIRAAARLGAQIVASGALAWGLMCLPWPYAHQNPVWHPIESALYAARFDETYRVLFDGSTLLSDDLPAGYLLQWIVLTTPLAHLAFAVAGLTWMFWRLRVGWRGSVLGAAATGWIILFPLGYFVVARPNVYDGWRQFLFLAPMLAVCARVGAAILSRRLPNALFARLSVPVLAAVLCLPVKELVTLHPYQAVYFNALAGSRETLHERY